MFDICLLLQFDAFISCLHLRLQELKTQVTVKINANKVFSNKICSYTEQCPTLIHIRVMDLFNNSIIKKSA